MKQYLIFNKNDKRYWFVNERTGHFASALTLERAYQNLQENNMSFFKLPVETFSLKGYEHMIVCDVSEVENFEEVQELINKLILVDKLTK